MLDAQHAPVLMGLTFAYFHVLPWLLAESDRRAGRTPTRYLTWSVITRLYRHYDDDGLDWRQMKLADQAEARILLHRRRRRWRVLVPPAPAARRRRAEP
jgi:hypothetical protein